MLLMFRNDTGFGGNNGMTGFPLLFGWPIGAPGVATGLAVAALLVLAAVLAGAPAARRQRASAAGCSPCRDDEARLRTLGYEHAPAEARDLVPVGA